jgi:TP901 family phage tail tape measure protein
MASKSKNDDIVKLIIKGEDEYSNVSEDVRQELETLASQAEETQAAFREMEQALDLAATYREQAAEVERLATLQAQARQEVDRLTKANKEANGENLKTATALAKARAELTSYRTATNRAQKAFDKTAESLRSYGLSIKDVEANQSLMERSSQRMAAELAELRAKQDALVNSAKDQAQTSREQAQAEEARAKVLERVGQVYARQVEEERKAREEQARVKAETEKLTAEIREQIGQLERGEINWQDYQRRVRDAGATADLTRRQVAEINREMDDQVIAARNANQALKEQAAEAKRVEQATEKYRLGLEKLVDQYRRGDIESEQFEQSTNDLRQKLGLTEDQVEQTRREMKAYVDQIERSPDANKRAGKSTDTLTKVTRRLAQAYTVLLAAQKSAQLVAGGYSAYTESENAMLGLQKTTELTASELNGLAEEMKRLSTEVTPTTKSELLGIAESAGRMGIQGAENIRQFTKSIDALSSATGLAGDETAQAIAQILNVTGEAQSNVTGVSAAIAELGNTSATTEDQIVHFAKRLASDTASVKLTSAEVLGLGTAIAEMGMQAEGASTVIGRTFRYIEDAIKGGGEPMEQLQRITGKTSEELEKAFGENKVQLFTDFVAGMGRMQDGGKTLNSILSDMGIKSDENARILGLLSQRHEGLSAAVERSNAAFEQGTAHFEEMAKKAASLESGFTKLQNRAKALQTAMGEAFSDDLSREMDEISESAGAMEERFAELGEALADVAQQSADLVQTIGNAFAPFEVLTGGVSILEAALGAVSLAFDGVSVVINTVTAAIAELGFAWNKFTGDTEDMEKWKKVWNDANQSVADSVKRQRDSLDRLRGDSSRAFQDLRDTYNENRNALEKMDAEQRKAVETIINSTGYIEGNDEAYRDLTRAIQRAAAEKRILEGATAEENAQLDAHIALLRAQGIEEEEAIRIAREKAAERKKAAQAAEEEAQAERERRKEEEDSFEALIKKQEEAAKAAEEKAKQVDEAYKTLGVNVAEITNKVTETGQKSADAFALVAGAGEQSAEVIRKAFDSALSEATTEADADYLKGKLDELAKEGVLSGKALRDAYKSVNKQIERLGDEFKKAGNKADDAKDDMAGLADEIENTSKRGTGSIGELVKVMQQLVEEVRKLKEGFKEAGDEAENMRNKADGNSEDGGSDSRSGGGKKYRSTGSSVANRYRAQGRDDVAQILEENLAAGKYEHIFKGASGLSGYIRAWEAVKKSAEEEADAIKAKYDELARYQRDIAAGDVAAAKQLLAQRNRFADLEADLVGIVTQAANLVNSAGSQQTGFQQPGQQVQQPPADVVTVRFDFGNGRLIDGQFNRADRQTLLDQLAEVASVTR